MSEQKADFIIVGGGVYGAATAYHLARAGVDVLVLERDRIAAGASGGFGKRGVRANGRDLRELPLMRQAYELWPGLAEELGGPTGWEPTGHLQLFEEEHHRQAAAARARVQEEAGIPSVLLGRDALVEIEPGVGTQVQGALHCPMDGIADHTATTQAYMSAALRHGARLREGATVTALEEEGGTVRAVRLADGERIAAARGVLLLANTGVQDLLPATSNRPLPVWTVYPQALRTQPAPSPPFRSLVGHAHRKLALKMLPDGSVMISGGWRGEPDEHGRGRTRPSAVEGNHAEAIRTFPAIGALDLLEAHADRAETMCVDGIPILDALPGPDNVWIGVGWTGHGWAIAPAVAPKLAEWVRTGAMPADLAPFSLRRFERV